MSECYWVLTEKTRPGLYLSLLTCQTWARISFLAAKTSLRRQETSAQSNLTSSTAGTAPSPWKMKHGSPKFSRSSARNASKPASARTYPSGYLIVWPGPSNPITTVGPKTLDLVVTSGLLARQLSVTQSRKD